MRRILFVGALGALVLLPSALAYGPRARNIHAADEAVELASIVGGARTLARFIARYFAAGGLPGKPDVISLDRPETVLTAADLRAAADEESRM